MNDLKTYLYLHTRFDCSNFIQNLGWNNVVADLFISNSCQLKCRHCYFGETKNHKSSLSLDEWKNVIDKLYAIGIRHYHFSGKESSMCSDTIILMTYIKQKENTYAGVVTNGLGKPEYYDKLLSSSIDYIEFSLDGTLEFNDFMRAPGAFDITINSIKRLDKELLEKVNIATCLNSLNIINYFDMLKQCIKLGIRKFFATPFYARGNGRKISEYSITISQYAEFIKSTFEFLEFMPNLGLRLKYCIPEGYMNQIWSGSYFLKSLIVDFYEKGTSHIYKINGNVIEISFSFFEIDYLNNISITNDGYIIPCSDDIADDKYFQNSLGNIIDMSTKEIESKRKKEIIKKIKSLKTLCNEINC